MQLSYAVRHLIICTAVLWHLPDELHAVQVSSLHLLLWVATVRLSSLQRVQPDSESLSSHDPLLTVQHEYRTHLLSLQSQTYSSQQMILSMTPSYNQHSSLWSNAAFLMFIRSFFLFPLPLHLSVPVLSQVQCLTCFVYFHRSQRCEETAVFWGMCSWIFGNCVELMSLPNLLKRYFIQQ